MNNEIINPASMGIWEEIKYYFKPKDFGEGWEYLDSRLLFILQRLRIIIEKPFVIHKAFTKTSENKHILHSQGKAVDFHIEGISFRDAYAEINKICGGIIGLGLYPFLDIPEFHLDIGKPRQWWEKDNECYGILDYPVDFNVIEGTELKYILPDNCKIIK